jgi:ribosome recycling factor
MSLERRKKFADMVSTLAEEARVAVRSARRDAKKRVDDGKKAGTFPEDDADRLHEEVQRLTDQYTGKVDDLLKRKTEEILKV